MPRGPCATARALSADTAALGALQSAVLGSGGPRAASACERPDTNRVRPLLTATAVTRPSRSQPRRQAWSLNTSHLSSARVGSRRAFSRERQFDEDHGEVVAGLVGLAEDETDFRIVITRPPAPSEKAAAQQQYGALAHNPLFEECRALQAAAEERERYSGIRKPRS